MKYGSMGRIGLQDIENKNEPVGFISDANTDKSRQSAKRRNSALSIYEDHQKLNAFNLLTGGPASNKSSRIFNI